jgi:hypothetical protein
MEKWSILEENQEKRAYLPKGDQGGWRVND